MNKLLVGLLIAGSITLVGGGAIMLTTLPSFKEKSSMNFVTNEHIIEESFENINIDVETAKVNIKQAEDGVNKVVCIEKEDCKHTVNVQDNSLCITIEDEREWHQKLFAFEIGQTEVNIYLNSVSYSNLDIKMDTGGLTVDGGFTFSKIDAQNDTGSIVINSNVTGKVKCVCATGSMKLENMTANSVDLQNDTGFITLEKVNVAEGITCENDTGPIKLTDVNCKTLNVSNDTGTIKLTNTIAEQNIIAKNSTGGIKLEKVDANSLNLSCSTGSITGTILTPKIFSCTSSTGKVTVPTSTTGGPCVATTSTGSINLSIAA